MSIIKGGFTSEYGLYLILLEMEDEFGRKLVLAPVRPPEVWTEPAVRRSSRELLHYWCSTRAVSTADIEE